MSSLENITLATEDEIDSMNELDIIETNFIINKFSSVPNELLKIIQSKFDYQNEITEKIVTDDNKEFNCKIKLTETTRIINYRKEKRKINVLEIEFEHEQTKVIHMFVNKLWNMSATIIEGLDYIKGRYSPLFGKMNKNEVLEIHKDIIKNVERCLNLNN